MNLNKEEKIKLGSFYTPQIIVERVHEFIKPFLESNKHNVVIVDTSGGHGVFINNLKNYDYRIADRDINAYLVLIKNFDPQKVFHNNSLLNINRNKYNILDNHFVIVIGNPPYNDTTSEYKKGKKGQNICDKDIYDKDIGISFLKSYYKLNADIVCVLHPLSYLIKQANFNRLKEFKQNYKLIKGEIFPSSLFAETGTSKFPIVIALYEKNKNGMTFDYIKKFKFDIWNSTKYFILFNYTTVDGFINKYPPRKFDEQESPIGLYYYSFRDLNSLKRNTAFTTNNKHKNGIVVTVENFYKYAYLYAVKKLFKPKNEWIYANISPLVDIEKIENNKKLYVLYAMETNKVLKKLSQEVKNKITEYYQTYDYSDINLNSLEEIISKEINSLALD